MGGQRGPGLAAASIMVGSRGSAAGRSVRENLQALPERRNEIKSFDRFPPSEALRLPQLPFDARRLGLRRLREGPG